MGAGVGPGGLTRRTALNSSLVSMCLTPIQQRAKRHHSDCILRSKGLFLEKTSIWVKGRLSGEPVDQVLWARSKGCQGDAELTPHVDPPQTGEGSGEQGIPLCYSVFSSSKRHEQAARDPGAPEAR